MASQAQLTAQLTATNSAIAILRTQLASAQPGSATQTQLSIAIYNLEQQRNNIQRELSALVTTSNPPDPSVPVNDTTPISESEVQTGPADVTEGDIVVEDIENAEPFDVNLESSTVVETDAVILTSPSDVPVTVEDDGGTLVEFTESGERIVDAENTDFVVSESGLLISAEDIATETETLEDGSIVEFTENGERIIDENGFVITEGGLRVAPEDIDAEEEESATGLREPTDADVEEAVRAQAALDQARQQATVSAMRKANGQAVGDGDWRVRLRLAPNAYYLYKSDTPGIMEPLQATDGVIFPYTPKIDIVYSASYNPTELTHSNYTGYFYKGSKVGEVVLNAEFTAQDSKEANYLLATIHFFKSCTKMFYGQDDDRGAPPPMVFLSGLGEFQFNEHPCVISSFNYSLPNDVDYIRARGRQVSSAGITQGGDGLMWKRTLASSTAPSYSLSSIWSRLTGANLPKGGQNIPPPPPNLGLNSPTYVPTKINISLTLLPMNTRSQVAQQFSLEKYANGNLLKGGFW